MSRDGKNLSRVVPLSVWLIHRMLISHHVSRIKLFGAQFLKELKEHEIEDAVANIAAALEAVCRRQDGAFTLNYIRLRFIAQREA